MGKVVFGEGSPSSEVQVIQQGISSDIEPRVAANEEQIGFTQSRLTKLIDKVQYIEDNTVRALKELQEPIVKLNDRVLQLAATVEAPKEEVDLAPLKDQLAKLAQEMRDTRTEMLKATVKLNQELEKQKAQIQATRQKVELDLKLMEDSLLPPMNDLHVRLFILENKFEKLTLMSLIRKLFG
jgi:uncharacterized protein (DUF342 family)